MCISLFLSIFCSSSFPSEWKMRKDIIKWWMKREEERQTKINENKKKRKKKKKTTTTTTTMMLYVNRKTNWLLHKCECLVGIYIHTVWIYIYIYNVHHCNNHLLVIIFAFNCICVLNKKWMFLCAGHKIILDS